MVRIIVATDFTPASKHAVEYAFNAFDAENTAFILVHVVHVDGPPPAFMFNKLIESLKLRAKYKFENLLTEITQPKFSKIINRIEYGSSVHSVIEKAAREENADLIIAGAGMRHNLEQMVMGDVATHLVSYSAFPVIIVPQQAAIKRIETIVNATGVEQTEGDFMRMMKFAEILKANVTMLHVYNNADRANSIQAKTIQELAMDKYGFNNVRFEYEVNTSAVKGIIKYLNKTNPDLLAVFPHKQVYLDRIFSHRITKDLAGKSAVPMLVVKN
ncbi:MAG: universal stress protein [Bacteroidetes bacterium]|nr:universal stress protein [Bacteroidota bacterium]MBP7399671.1 universal stress protein [Chitinophagales bacterium]MBK7108096.1 universal stress protein [Bacteroidota bacterium]MBK8486469.1 universal stress protein [Bacteroidota bacterium]MBK8683249.1 universal stress protein [Bacteroidota bacterium]